MIEAWLPYGRTEVAVRIPNENLLGIVDLKEWEGAKDPVRVVDEALKNPLRASRLAEVSEAGKKVAVVVDDKTSPLPTRLILNCLLGELTRGGIREEDVSVIFGCGAHSMTEEEASSILGEGLEGGINIHVHDCRSEDLECVGETSFGTSVSVNRTFMDANLRILTGDIAPHCYAGYGGGRKSLLPAIAGAESIRHNHSLLLDTKARTGNLEGNPVHLDMEEALELVDVDFALNVVLNPRGEVIKAFAGDVDEVFYTGVKLADRIYKADIKSPADIVIVSPGGHPFDIDLYQACKGLDPALNAVKDNGVVILVAECLEGYSNEAFHDWMLRFNSLKMVEREIKRDFILGGHKAYHLLKALERVEVILVSTMPDYYASGVFKLRTAKTVNSALEAALKRTGKRSEVLVLPHGSTILPSIS